MSTLLEEPASEHLTGTAPAQRLQTTMAAVRVSLSWLGVRKSLTADQKAQAADTFGASDGFLSATKKLIETGHPAFKAVTAIRYQAIQYWRSMSLPYPEPGVRLIRQDKIDEFHHRMNTFRAELAEAVAALNRRYAELRELARQRLGQLYNPSDYPETLCGLFAIEWEFPAVEPPDYLQHLNPAIYEQECQRVQQRFDEAVRLAEEAFITELGRLVSHLAERLTGQEDGKPKIFRDSIVENLTDFFQRFRSLNVRSNDDLDQLVARAQRIVRGVEPQALRNNAALRDHVAAEMTRVQSALDGLLVDRPRRNILRRPR